ncbi:hypothetical protein BLA60_25865 [Actinophytocola xinjiangensis]|uniref:Tail protein n=1 Tax=Actinophytocola xinjiangensis TaxID=485602 RepID=A0A7Z0WJR2_9PSEU|nr:hypothetical protein [Actinophytocola xinjiangensis]OLF07759.1 hypothetical protein BLA60_25865 [Actinophytocola xinjiangensis]
MITPVVDAYLGGDWRTLDASTGGTVRQSPPIKITAGAKDEAAKTSPSKATFTLNDPDGDYDPGNPMSQWFGDLKENTRVRVTVPLTEPVSFTHTIADGPGADADQVPGEFWNSETRYHVELPVSDVTGGIAGTVLQLRYLDANNFLWVQVVYHTTDSVQVGVIERVAGSDRRLLADTRVYPDGTLFTVNAFSVVVLVEGQVVRAKVWADGDPEPLDWQVECTRATVRAGATFLASTLDAGNTNTMPWVMEYTDVRVGIPVFYGEVAEFNPAVADESHAAPTVAITASGIGRRVAQGSDPLKSSAFRSWTSPQGWIREGSMTSTSGVGSTNTMQGAVGDSDDVPVGSFFRLLDETGRYKEDQLFTVTANSGGQITFTPDTLEPIVLRDVAASYRLATEDDLPIAYWPMEDDRGSTSPASGLLGGAPMETRVDTPEFAAFDVFAGSAPLVKLNNAELYGTVPDYTDTNQAFTLAFLARFPDADEAGTGQAIVQFYCTGTAEVWALNYATGGGDGDLVLSAYSATTGAQLFSTPYDMGMRGNPRLVTLNLEQTGPTTVQYSLLTVGYTSAGGTSVAGPATATATGVTALGKITSAQVNPGGGYVDVGFGHLAVVPAVLSYINITDRISGYAQENPPRRFARLAYEEGEPVTYCQGIVPAGILGPQRRDTLLDTWQDVTDFDMGRFYEAKGAYRFEYRTRSSLYNQGHILDLDYEGGAVLAPFDPVRDDQGSRNDITVKREGGSTYRAVKESGAKSVEAIGRYTDAPTVNAAFDRHLPDLAHWRLHLGTVDGDRYPTITVKAADGVLSLERLLSVGVGDRVRVTNAGARRRFEPIDQLVPGYTLTLHPYVPTLAMNCVPASPYNVAVLDEDTVRLDSDTSALDDDITSSAATFDVATTDCLWTTDPDHFPFDVLVGGERCTVTAISGASSPQAFTVTRAVNGVARAWSAGTKVSLADPHYLPL